MVQKNTVCGICIVNLNLLHTYLCMTIVCKIIEIFLTIDVEFVDG